MSNKLTTIIIGAVVVVILSACNNGIERLTYLYGKKLATPRGPLFSGKELIIYRDSTFEYTQGGPAIHYTRGIWFANSEHSSITLKSTTHYGNLKQIVDTFFLKFESKIVKIKGRKKVEMDNQIFKYWD